MVNAMHHYLGIDLGTSSLKIVVCNQKGEILANKVQSYEVLFPKNGWHEQDTDDWLNALKKVIDEVSRENPKLLDKLQTISVTGQMHGIVPVNAQGDALHHAIIWSDQRNVEELDSIKALLPEKEWVKITGNRPNISFTIGKIMWFKKHYPNLYKKTTSFLLPKDFIRFKLNEKLATDYSDASATLLMDVEKKSWSKEILELIGLDENKLPPIQESTVTSGFITEKASKAYGLKKGIPIICGCGDAQAQAIGNGIVNEKDWLCTIGTSGQLFVSIDNLSIDPNGTVHTLAHGDPRKWVIMGATLSAGMSFKWLAESIFNRRYSFQELLDLAGKAKPGANWLLFLPYLNGERTPHMDEHAKGAFIGLTNEHTHAEMARAVVEGVLFSLYQAFEIVKQITNAEPKSVVLAGGVSEHPLWLSTAANIFNVPVIKRGSRGGGAYGAAMLAAVGAGNFKDLDEVSNLWGLRDKADAYHADPSLHQTYKDLYTIYVKTYDSLKGIYKNLSDLDVKN